MVKRSVKKRSKNSFVAVLAACGICLSFPFLVGAMDKPNTLNAENETAVSAVILDNGSSEKANESAGRTSISQDEETSGENPAPVNHIPFKLTTAAPVFRSLDTQAGTIANLNRGDDLMLSGTLCGKMAKARIADGRVGYIDKTILTPEILGQLTEEKLVAVNPLRVFNIFSENAGLSIEEKLTYLKSVYEEGKYFNSSGVNVVGLSQEWSVSVTTDIPCNHSENGYRYCQTYLGLTSQMFDGKTNIQCLAFASVISDFLFGKETPIVKLSSFEQLKAGDHIRLVKSQHSLIVLEVKEDSVTALECNSDYESCKIAWGRTVTKADIEKEEHMYLSRRTSAG